MVVADKVVGLIAVQMIAMALFRRERAGKGCSIDIPMFENLVKFVLEEHMYLKTFEPPLGPTGDPRILDAHNRPIPTLDGYISMSANTDKQAFAFFDAIGRPELKSDPRFRSVPARFANVKEYFQVRMDALKSRTTAEWLEIFDRCDVPAMPYHTLDSLMEDPHLREVGFFRLMDHPTEGKTRVMRLPNKWSSGVRHDFRPAPKLGQHSVEILREIGCSEAEIEAMLAAKATFDGRLDKR
jgi:crotonobetainyl-CoA:carnitine CoA-transferase CaiB-like acyl-CoA transferase